MFNFSWFKASNKEDQNASTWNPNTLTMEQPSSPSAPVAQQNQGAVTEQPSSQEQMQIRGGHGGGGICCGICAGLACFECCEICC